MATSNSKKGAMRFQRETPPKTRDDRSAEKPRQEPIAIVCRSCSAVLKNNTWIWGNAPPGSESGECPACKQIADFRPSATVHIPTEIVQRQRQEIFALIRNIETIEKQRNPLERIIRICDDHKSIVIDTTGQLIAERIAHAIGTVTRATITTRDHFGVLTLVVA